MLLKFTFQDFLDDRKFKNTTKVNIRNYQTMLGEFFDYCNENQIMNVEDITSSTIRSYLLKCQDKGNNAGTINTKLMRTKSIF
ncbi:site-specific integrase [Paenibacillus sp. Y5S-9]|uniref:site-specific integrase n=1 Tax=Paenibacillus sp. Y5S-9 TaxID=3122489 RepID=UPI0030D0A64B